LEKPYFLKGYRLALIQMNPSSLDIDFWLRRAKGSAVQRHKDMNRNRLGDELGETNKLFGSELLADEGSHAVAVAFTDGRSLAPPL
jgi:hypothetical protein